jgi:hypothetical protein
MRPIIVLSWSRRARRAALAMLLCVWAAGGLTEECARAASVEASSGRVRSSNERINEVLARSLDRSPLLRNLVVALNQLDRVVYVEEGTCPHREQRSCLQLMPTAGGTYMLIKIDSRRSSRVVAAQVAHELYHALEIAREPLVVDAPSFKSLYDRIGRRYCYGQYDGCWETQAALDFEVSVTRQLSSAASTADGSR